MIIKKANLLVGKKSLKKNGSIAPVQMQVVINMGRAHIPTQLAPTFAAKLPIVELA